MAVIAGELLGAFQFPTGFQDPSLPVAAGGSTVTLVRATLPDDGTVTATAAAGVAGTFTLTVGGASQSETGATFAVFSIPGCFAGQTVTLTFSPTSGPAYTLNGSVVLLEGASTATRAYVDAGSAAPSSSAPASIVDFGASTSASAAVNTAAVIAALATGRPVYIPGPRSNVYKVNELSAHITNYTTFYGNGTLQLADPAATGIIAVTGLTGISLGAVTWDANANGPVAVRFIQCTDFDLGSSRFLNAQIAGCDCQECSDFRGDKLVANNNGKVGGAVGSGVYLREMGGGTGCQRFDITSIDGTGNGVDATQGDTVHTSGSNCTGQIGTVHARNGTEYGAKFQHTGGFVQVLQVKTSGNVNAGVTATGCSGLQIRQISSNGDGAGLWIDANTKLVQIGAVWVHSPTNFGVQVNTTTSDIQIDEIYVATTQATGASGRGLDLRGVTRGKFGKVTLYDIGTGASNTTNPFYMDANSHDVQIDSMTITDDRAGTARIPNYGTINGVTPGDLRITKFVGKGAQASDMTAFPNILSDSVDFDGKTISAYGSATILSGGTTVAVTHGLIRTPTVIIVTGSSSDTSACWITAPGTTTFTINVSGAVGANRTVYWRAGIVQQATV